MSVSAPIPDPPPAASKWLDLLDRLVVKQLVPLAILMVALWWFSGQFRDQREELKAARAETARLIDKLIARTDEKSKEVQAAVKEVKTEVKATTEAVKAAAPTQTP